jgi:hypothetical protein
MGNVDRKKHVVDVLERVLGDVQTALGPAEPHTKVIDVEVRPWLGGSRTSAMQLTIGILSTEVN